MKAVRVNCRLINLLDSPYKESIISTYKMHGTQEMDAVSRPFEKYAYEYTSIQASIDAIKQAVLIPVLNEGLADDVFKDSS